MRLELIMEDSSKMSARISSNPFCLTPLFSRLNNQDDEMNGDIIQLAQLELSLF